MTSPIDHNDGMESDMRIETTLAAHGLVVVEAELFPSERESGTREHWELHSVTLAGSDEELDLTDAEELALSEALSAAERGEDGPPDEYYENAAESFVDDECGYDPYSGAWSEDC